MLDAQTLKQELDRKAAQLAAVREISRAIVEAQDVQDILDLITMRTTELLGVQSSSIYLYNREEDALVLAATTGLNPDGIEHVSLPRGVGLTGWAALNSELVAVENAAADSRFYHIVGSGESRFASLMAMPLITRGKVIGAANVQTTQNHEFSQDEIELFSFITDLAATALEKAKLVHSAVVREIHHRVKNNLQTIAMLLRLQVAQADSLTPQDILQETINRVLSIAAVHEILAQDHHSQIGLLQLVRQVAQFISASMTLRGHLAITVEGDDLKLPTQYATNLALVTNELIQNALEHSLTYKQDGQIRIKLRSEADCLELTVTDNGRGLPPDFTMEENRGLGLDLVYTMVTEDLEGDFSLEPSRTGGTQAIVRVPTGKMKEQTINDLY